jgi:hypothetical protein
VRERVLLRGSAPRRVRPGQRIRVRLAVKRRRGATRRLTVRLRVPRSLRPGRRAVVFEGFGGGSDSFEEQLPGTLSEFFGEGVGGDGASGPLSIGQLIGEVQSLRRPLGITARFRKRGGSIVYRNNDVRFTGRARVALRVVRPHRHRHRH